MKVYTAYILFILIETATADYYNVAIDKAVTGYPSADVKFAAKAVDGDSNLDSCTQIISATQTPWLCVDLLYSYGVHDITVITKKGSEDKIKGFEIRLSDTGPCSAENFASAKKCYADKSSKGVEKYYIQSCNENPLPSYTGRYVYVSLPEKPAELNICELQVFAEICPVGFYGEHCQFKCQRNCLNNVCEKTRGSCSDGCSDGYYGLFCRSQCNPKCKDRKCCSIDGKCHGCEEGHFGDFCMSKVSE